MIWDHGPSSWQKMSTAITDDTTLLRLDAVRRYQPLVPRAFRTLSCKLCRHSHGTPCLCIIIIVSHSLHGVGPEETIIEYRFRKRVSLISTCLHAVQIILLSLHVYYIKKKKRRVINFKL